MKKTIVYYSDCPFFAGCENMIANFLSSSELSDNYEIFFMFRSSKDYNRGLSERVNNSKIRYTPLKLFPNDIHRKILQGIKRKSFIYNSFSILIIPIWKYASIFLNIFILLTHIKKIKPDILHINNGGYPAAFSCYSMVFAAKISEVTKIVYVVNNLAQGYKNPLRWFDYLLDKIIKNYVNMFITGSAYAGDRLKSVLNIPTKKIINIYNGVNVGRKIQSKDNFLFSNNIKNQGRKIFSTVAILEERKGHIYLLVAINLLKEKIDINDMPIFLIEGEGPEKGNLEKFVINNELESIVLFIGHIKNIFDLYNASDAIILPSINNEDFPNVIIEAMGMGKPVIGTKIAGIPEQIDDNVNGLLVDPANPKGLCTAIEYLLHPDTLKKMGKKGLEKYSLNYTPDLAVDQYLKIYQKILGEL